MGDLGKFIAAMKWAADSDRVGYSQSGRWGVVFYGKGKYNADCSSLVIQALRYAGFDTGDASYTGNMSANLCARGWKRMPVNGRPKPGDILLNDVNHVAVCVADGKLAQASIDEHGRIAGGKRGDQTGNEVNVRGYYSYPWNCYLRWRGELPKPASPQYRAFREGKWRGWKRDGRTAGLSTVPLYGFECKGLGPKGWYRLTVEGKRLAKNKPCSDPKKRITRVEVYYDTPEPESTGYYEAVYRACTDKGWTAWERDVNGGGVGDGTPIRRVQLKLGPC